MLVQNNFLSLALEYFVAPIEAISAGYSGLTLLFRNQYLFIDMGEERHYKSTTQCSDPPI